MTLAQSQDITLSSLNKPNTQAALYLGANYAHRIVYRRGMALSGQIDFAASPNRKPSVLDPLGSRDVASLPNGAPYSGSRAQNDFAASGGIGMDVHIVRFAGLRFELKNYRKNVAAGVVLHFRWRGK